MTDRPDVAAAIADPATVPVDQIPIVIGELEKLKAALWARLVVPTSASNNGGEDHLLTLDQAAERLGTSRDWLRRQKMLPFRVEVSPGQVRYSTLGLERFIARRAGK